MAQPAPSRPARAGAATDSNVTRRWILRWGVMGGLGLLLVEGLGAFTAFFWPSRVGAFGGKVLAGKPEDFKVGEPKYVRDGKFYLMRLPEGFLALYQKCPHLGCVVPWRPGDPSEDPLAPQGRFNCPCHGSIYDRYGVLKTGPAPRPMDIMKIEIAGPNLVVNTGDVTERSEYDPSQLFTP